MSQNVADLFEDMLQGYAEGRYRSREGRRPENTTPTRFEEFADVLARAYQAV